MRVPPVSLPHNILSALRFGILSTLLVVLISCGGGSTGTGGNGSEFSGKLLDLTGSPVMNATLTIEETGDSATTSSDGSFTIESNVPTGPVTLLVQAENSEGRTVMHDIPSGQQLVTINLRFNAREHTVEITDRVVKPRPRPTARPRPTRRPATTPVPAPADTPPPPTAVPVEPTAIPTLVPTLVSTATPVAIQRTVFKGKIEAVDAELLSTATIGIRGRARHSVSADGTFEFDAKLFEPAKVLIIKAGSRFGRVGLPSVTNSTKTVNLSLSISQNDAGGLDIFLNSIVLMQRADSAPMIETPPEPAPSGVAPRE